MQTPTTALSVVLNDTLANLTFNAPYAAVYRGHYAAVSDNSALYWIDQDGNLQLVNFNVAGYTGFTFTDGTTPSSNIASGGVITFTDGAGVDVSSSGSALTVALAGAAAATAGQVPVSDGSGGVAFSAPLAIAAASASLASINASNELELSNLLISDVTVDASAVTIAAFVAASYTAGTEFQEGDVIVLSAATGGSTTYIHNGGAAGTDADFTAISNPAGAIQNFGIAADSGTAGTIVDGETYTVAGGTGVATAIAGDTVTVSLDGPILELAGVTQPGTVGQYVIQYDQATDAYTYVAADSFDTSLADTDQVLTGARSVTQAANALTFAMTGGDITMSGGSLVASAGDIEVATTTSGLVLKSPDGSRFRYTANNIGVLTGTSI